MLRHAVFIYVERLPEKYWLPLSANRYQPYSLSSACLAKCRSAAASSGWCAKSSAAAKHCSAAARLSLACFSFGRSCSGGLIFTCTSRTSGHTARQAGSSPVASIRSRAAAILLLAYQTKTPSRTRTARQCCCNLAGSRASSVWAVCRQLSACIIRSCSRDSPRLRLSRLCRLWRPGLRRLRSDMKGYLKSGVGQWQSRRDTPENLVKRLPENRQTAAGRKKACPMCLKSCPVEPYSQARTGLIMLKLPVILLSQWMRFEPESAGGQCRSSLNRAHGATAIPHKGLNIL